ncbi:MAG: hypothetical protein IH921_00690 [Gemmatimonadetes bacterium]|nr:hypothetical protein [Gemmatimonadota bacterium]
MQRGPALRGGGLLELSTDLWVHRRDVDEPTDERMVHLATAGVSRRLALPPFDAWAEDYARNPAQYEAQFLGLWESELGEALDA